jgi:chromosome partitioning protein
MWVTQGVRIAIESGGAYVRHAFVADPMAFRLQSLSNGPQRLSLAPQSDHFADRLLFGLMRDGLTALATSKPKGDFPPEIPTSRLLSGLAAKLKALEEAGFVYAVVDTPPAITDAIRAVVALADLVLIPVKPSPHDLRAVGRTVETAREGGKAFCFVLTQAKGNALLTVQAMAAPSVHGIVAPAVMHDRVDYASSMTDGRKVLEADPKGRSAAEIAALWKFVKRTIARKHERTKGSSVKQKAAPCPRTSLRSREAPRRPTTFRPAARPCPPKMRKRASRRSISECRPSSGTRSRPMRRRTT